MLKTLNPKLRLLLVCVATSILTGCAMGKMIMAGYKPPQTIADLMNQQYALAGELPPELRDDDGQSKRAIDLQGYKGQQNSELETSSRQMYLNPYERVQSFRPSFTYKGVEDYASQMSMQLVKNAVGLTPNMRIGVASFVKLDETLQNTTVLGNQMAEHFLTQLQEYGLGMVDHKLMPVLQVTNRGDIAFSRDVMKLSQQKVMDHVLTGTMIEKHDGIFVNARILSLQDNRVIASAHLTIPWFVANSINRQYVSL